MKKRNFLILATLLINISACSGTAPKNQYNDILRRSDVEALGKAMQEEVEKHYSVLQHKLVNRYINSLGQSIVARNPQMPPLPYQFRVLRVNEVNIFSIPGGIVYVTLGAIGNVELEGQLAAAIAHELAHQDAGHSLILWRERIVNAQQWAKSAKSYAEDGFEAHYFAKNGLLDYGEKYEDEADEIALVLLYQAGYDPRTYVSYLEELQRLQARAPKLVHTMLGTNPQMDRRMAKVRDYLRALPPKKESKLTSATFKEIKHRLRLADKMMQKNKGKSNGKNDEL